LGGAKGYALGLLIELLAKILTGGTYGTHGHSEGLWSALAVVLYIPFFIDPAEFRRQASALVEQVKESPKAPGFEEILVPGERAYRLRRERLQGGIPHSGETWRTVIEYCREAGLDAANYAS